jgi:DNA-binding NarL/FixJ family response regulator
MGRQIEQIGQSAAVIISPQFIRYDAILLPEIQRIQGLNSSFKPASEPSLVDMPTRAETDVLRLLPTQFTARQIAENLFLSVNTVKSHQKRLHRKLGAHSRTEAVDRANALGLLDPPDPRRREDVSSDPKPLLVDSPTEAEIRVLQLLPTHLTAGQIAANLAISKNTIRTHIGHMYRKLGVHSRTEAVERASALGLLDPPDPRRREDVSSDPKPQLVNPLTTTETNVLRLLRSDLTTREIAKVLHVSVNTVKSHQKRLHQKLGAHSRTEAVERASALGLFVRVQELKEEESQSTEHLIVDLRTISN